MFLNETPPGATRLFTAGVLTEPQNRTGPSARNRDSHGLPVRTAKLQMFVLDIFLLSTSFQFWLFGFSLSRHPSRLKGDATKLKIIIIINLIKPVNIKITKFILMRYSYAKEIFLTIQTSFYACKRDADILRNCFQENVVSRRTLSHTVHLLLPQYTDFICIIV